MSSDHALDVTLFGAGAFSFRGETLEGLAAKEIALLAYLAVEARAVPREELSALLWGPRGANNLRQALYRLRQRPGAEHWLRDGERVELVARCDVRELEQRIRRGELPVLPASPRLLDALVLRRDPEFHEWLAELRTRVERTIERVHLERARALVAAGRLEEARDALLSCEHPEAAALLADLASRRALAPRSTLEVPGRERETAELDALLRAGRSCCVVGPTGIGKSHLVRAVVPDALVVEAHPADVHLPHGALARWLRVCTREVAELSEGAQASLAHLAPSALPDVVAAAAPTAGMLAAAERELGRRLASRTVVLDGLEHHDPDSLRALARIVGEALDAGAAWILVARPVALARPELRASIEDPRVARLELGPLSLAAFRRFAAESPERDALHALSGGNPQLALAVWRDRDRAHRLAAPTRVGIAARLRASDDETRALLGLLALCDEPLEVDALALALERDPLVVARRMAAAEDEGWLDETGGFASPLVREVVVEELGDAERRWLHARRALALVSMHAAPRRIATAWLAAGRATEATPFTLGAAREALRASAPESAAEALADLPDDLPAELAVEAALLEADVARQRGEPAAEDDALTRAEARAFASQSDPSLYAVALRRAEERLRTRGAPAARDAASEAAAIATRLGDVEGRAAAFAWLGEVELRAGALDRAQECFSAASTSRDVAVRVRGLWGLGLRRNPKRLRACPRVARRGASPPARRGLVDRAALANGLGATAERCYHHVEGSDASARRSRWPNSAAIATRRSVPCSTRPTSRARPVASATRGWRSKRPPRASGPTRRPAWCWSSGTGARRSKRPLVATRSRRRSTGGPASAPTRWATAASKPWST
ncbi:MAG: AAA family ATPase [Polyangiales bacterium]